MSMLGDVLAALKATSEWNSLVSAARRVPELEARIAALEERLAGGANVCPSCGGGNYRIAESIPDPIFGSLGGNRRTYRCDACGFSEQKVDG